MKEKLQPVIVRTYSAGVHFGYLVSREGKEVRLTESRRIWSWEGANTLSEMATSGLNPNKSRVSVPVDIILTEAIEIIICLPEAEKILKEALWTK